MQFLAGRVRAKCGPPNAAPVGGRVVELRTTGGVRRATHSAPTATAIPICQVAAGAYQLRASGDRLRQHHSGDLMFPAPWQLRHAFLGEQWANYFTPEVKY